MDFSNLKEKYDSEGREGVKKFIREHPDIEAFCKAQGLEYNTYTTIHDLEMRCKIINNVANINVNKPKVEEVPTKIKCALCGKFAIPHDEFANYANYPDLVLLWCSDCCQQNRALAYMWATAAYNFMIAENAKPEPTDQTFATSDVEVPAETPTNTVDIPKLRLELTKFWGKS